MATKHVLVILSSAAFVACAAQQRETPRPVTTTSAGVERAACNAPLSMCFHNSDCCSRYCDYDQYFCH